MKRPAVFIDRDGTISEEVGYVNHPSRFRVFPYSSAAIRILNDAGWLAIVITNQAGVARGYFSEDVIRSEEHTSELQSQSNLVCRLLLEKKNNRRSQQQCQRHRNLTRTYTCN